MPELMKELYPLHLFRKNDHPSMPRSFASIWPFGVPTLSNNKFNFSFTDLFGFFFSYCIRVFCLRLFILMFDIFFRIRKFKTMVAEMVWAVFVKYIEVKEIYVESDWRWYRLKIKMYFTMTKKYCTKFATKKKCFRPFLLVFYNKLEELTGKICSLSYVFGPALEADWMKTVST